MFRLSYPPSNFRWYSASAASSLGWYAGTPNPRSLAWSSLARRPDPYVLAMLCPLSFEPVWLEDRAGPSTGPHLQPSDLEFQCFLALTLLFLDRFGDLGRIVPTCLRPLDVPLREALRFLGRERPGGCHVPRTLDNHSLAVVVVDHLRPDLRQPFCLQHRVH